MLHNYPFPCPFARLLAARHGRVYDARLLLLKTAGGRGPPLWFNVVFMGRN